MSFEDKYNAGALYANMNQLASLMATKEKLMRISAPQRECDYMFHYGALEYKVEGFTYKADLLQRQIEIKCEDQSLSKEQTEKRAKADFVKRTKERALKGQRVIAAVKRLEEPMPSPKEIKEGEKLLESLISKLHPFFTCKASKTNTAILNQAYRYFEKGNVKGLTVLDHITPKAPPIKQEDHVKHNMFITVKIKQTVAALNLLQKGYPFDKIELVADRTKLPKLQKELSEGYWQGAPLYLPRYGPMHCALHGRDIRRGLPRVDKKSRACAARTCGGGQGEAWRGDACGGRGS